MSAMKAVSQRASAPRCVCARASLRCVPSMSAKGAARTLAINMAFMTPSQFSSFHGARMLLPACIVPLTAKLAARASATAFRKPAQMSFLGVGAPEALLVGVVALVVFGPKGLADAAKSLGKTLRAFQPTIREVVAVSQDLKGTLEQELGLDELKQAARVPPPVPTPRPRSDDDAASPSAAPMAAVSDTMARVVDPEIERKREESMKMAWGGQVPQTLEQPAAAAAPAQPAARDLSTMSSDELEAELRRRREAKQ